MTSGREEKKKGIKNKIIIIRVTYITYKFDLHLSSKSY